MFKNKKKVISIDSSLSKTRKLNIALSNQNRVVATNRLEQRALDTCDTIDRLYEIVEDVSKHSYLQMDIIRKIASKVSEYTNANIDVTNRAQESKSNSSQMISDAQDGFCFVEGALTKIVGIENLMNSAVTSIGNLQCRTSEIDNSLKVIKDVTEQTNMLAISAAIDAAKFNNKGSGFNVIASDIRALANECNYAISKIDSIVKEINSGIFDSELIIKQTYEKINHSVDNSNHAIQSFKETKTAVFSVSDINESVASSLDSQSDTLNGVVKSTEDMASLANKSSSLIEIVTMIVNDVKESTLFLLNVADDLKKIIHKQDSDDGDNVKYGTKISSILFSSRIDSFDPIFQSTMSERSIVKAIHGTLLNLSDSSEPIPGVAKYWVFDEASFVWKIFLRKGVKFHNESLVTAQDVKYSLERLLHPKTQSPYANLLFPIDGAEKFHRGEAHECKGINVVNETQLEIKLTSSNPEFLFSLCHPACSIVSSNDLNTGTPVGCGPYLVKLWDTVNGVLELETFDAYYGGAAYVRNLRLSVVRGREILSPLDSYDLFEISDKEKMLKFPYSNEYQFRSFNVFGTFVGAFNVNGPSGVLYDKAYREYLQHILDRNKIVDKIGDSYALAAEGIIPSFRIWNGIDVQSSLNRIDAKRTRFGSNELHTKKLHMAVVRQAGDLISGISGMQDIIVDTFQAAGISCDIDAFESAEWKINSNRARYDIIFFEVHAVTGAIGDFLLSMLNLHSSLVCDVKRNNEVETLLKMARETVSPDSRNDMYRDIQKLILEDCMIFPICHPRKTIALRNYVCNAKSSPLGDMKLDDLMINELL